MLSKQKLLLALTAVVCCFSIFYACKTSKTNTAGSQPVVKPRVLVFTKTKGYFHESIPTGAAAIQKLGSENAFTVDTTSNSAYFIEDSLKQYSAVIFLSTTGNVLNADQQVAFERYIQAGGNFVGIHAATDTEYDWPWYNKLVGAQFLSHPRQQKATIIVTDKNHPASSVLPQNWERFDEWYNFKNIQPDLKVLANLDETTYQGGQNGDTHPFIWYHEFDGGRAFYTGAGHTKESYFDTQYLQHLLGGIKYAIGNNQPLDYSKAYAVKSPEDNRFTKTILSDDLNEPMELAVAPDGRVFFTERGGKFYMYDPVAKKTKLVYDFPVKAVEKYLNGLIGITLDPDFSQNNYIYFFYSSNTDSQYHQNISRFVISQDGTLDIASEKIIIKIPIDLEVSAHTGGSLAWDKNRNLFIGTGDNTVPFQSDGYAPMDERPGRQIYDAQRSAGNPNDLRGKILRIHPEPDGSYTVPEGNLFPKGTPGTRSEIYVMGCRNPYRIAVDQETSFLYWGEIGPDAGQDSRHGPRGYDEFNQARQPGNFGWPFFVGNNKAYNDSDFATKAIGPLFNESGPTNNSPNNTGIKLLPAPQKPLIYYPYNLAEEFPALGVGGRCAMGGPIYHYDAASTSSTKLPAFYDKAFFIYDWMRNWVFAVRLDENYNYKRMDPFMATNGDFRRPVDVEIGPDGSMYMLEYGSVYGINNTDARLVRIDYNGGNRAPVAKINTRDTIGLAPLKVTFASRNSFDPDEDDRLTYEWSVDGKPISTLPNPSYTFGNNGVYNAVLKVTDQNGSSSSDTMEIKVGNTLPQVAIRATDNSTFFFSKTTALNYKVDVSDKEDGAIDKKNVKVSLKYIPKVAGAQAQMGHQQINENYNYGLSLMANSDCKACHQMDAKSVGPSFMAISKKYINDKNAPGYLANKIITGGSGVWGEPSMSAHPQLSKEDATEIVKYVLSVSNKREEKALPQEGSVILGEHVGGGEEGRYILTASYTDKGGAITPLTNRDVLVLRPAKVQVEDADNVYNLRKTDQGLAGLNNRSYFMFKNIDLHDIDNVTYRIASLDKGATIRVHIDSLQGKVVSTLNYKPTGARNKFVELSAPVSDVTGKHDLYFLFVKLDTPNKNIGSVDWVRFEGGGKEVVAEPENEKKPKTGEKPITTPPTGPKAPVRKLPGDNLKKPSAPVKKPTVSASQGMALMAKSDCKACHAVKQRLVGPAFADIAKRYKSSPAVLERLAGKIISGGAGAWGQIPMTPHPQIPKQDAMEIARYILTLKK
ncbi:MAG: glycosyl hydrolase [Segetibacter sp.]|nr:glycosyl hydrolase [Segetibacter sp.]